MPVITVIGEAEAGKSLEARRQKITITAEIAPFRSSLGNKSETSSQIKKKKNEIMAFAAT